MLNGTQEANKVVRSVFSSIVTTPPQSFGTVTSNVPRVRQSELFTPAELMVVLHEKEKEIGLKSTIEGTSAGHVYPGSGVITNATSSAIGICFSMADIYRSEILAVVMQQIVDEPVLPTLFLRTVSWIVAPARPVGTPLTGMSSSGDPSCEDVQVAGRVRFDHPPLTVNYQEDLDEWTPMGRIHRVCEGDCAGQLRRVATIAQGAA